MQLSGTSLNAGGGVSIAAGNNVVLGTDVLENHQASRQGDSRWQLDSVTQAGVVVTAGGGVRVVAGNDVTAIGARVDAGGSVAISAGGNINLLAADEMRQESSANTSRSGTETTQDSYTQTSRGTEINAGGSVSVNGAGDVTLQGAIVNAQQGIDLHAGGQLALRGVTERDMYSETSSNTSAWWSSSENKGHDTTTVRLTQLNGGVGGVNLSAVAGIVADYRVAAQQGGQFAAEAVLGRAMGRPDGVRNTIAALSTEPGLEWMAQIANDPTVDWNALQESHKEWNESHEMMGPAAMAVLAAVIAVCSAGAGLGAALAVETVLGSATLGTAASASLFAGATSLITSAASAIINNKGNLGDALRDFASDETVRGLAVSMVTAALTAGVAQAAGVNMSFSRTLANYKDPMSTTAITNATLNTAARYGINYAGGVLVNTTIGGQDFSTAIRTGLASSAAGFIGEIGASNIGDIGNATAGQNVVRIALHGALGCGIGAIQGDCGAGAIGAVAAELAGEFDIYKPGQPNSPYISNFSTAIAQLIGTTAAALAGRDAKIGGMAGENAVRNNSIASCAARGQLPGCNVAQRQLSDPPLSMGAPVLAAGAAVAAAKSGWFSWLFGSDEPMQMDAIPSEPVNTGHPAPPASTDQLPGFDPHASDSQLPGYNPDVTNPQLPGTTPAPPAQPGDNIVPNEQNSPGENPLSGVSPNIHPGQQGKHIIGDNNRIPGRSPLHPNVDPQQLLDGAHSGQYPVVGTSGRGDPIVDFGNDIGTDVSSGRPTQYGTIHSGKNGAHIVPANPNLIGR